MGLTALNNPLSQDIEDIVRAPAYPDTNSSSMSYEVILHTEEKDLDHRDGVVVSGIRTHRNYVNLVSDYIEITLMILHGTYIYDVHEFLENLEVTLYKTRQFKPQGRPVVVAERYKAVYLLEHNSSNPTTSTATRELLNQNPPLAVTLQLLDRSAEATRIKTTQGSFSSSTNKTNKDMSVKSFLWGIIGSHLDRITIAGNKAFDVIDIEEPNNKEQLRSLVIPSETRILDLADYIQNKSDGVYNSGIGVFMQRFSRTPTQSEKLYSVYSIYDSSKYHTAPVKAIFYAPPTSSLSINDKTFTYEDGILRAVVNHISNLDDVAESILMSKGSGYKRGINPGIMAENPFEITDEGPKFRQEDSTVAVVYKDRADGLHYAPKVSNTTNPYKASSDLMSKMGMYVTIKANNLDIDYIYPAMACKISYIDGANQLIELYGVIHKVDMVEEQQNLDMTRLFTSSDVNLSSAMEITVFVTEGSQHA